MRCIGRTKTFKRCKNETGILCKHHYYQIYVAIFSIFTFIATAGGLFQDVIKPLISKNGEIITKPNKPSLRDYFGLFQGNSWTFSSGNIQVLDYKNHVIRQKYGVYTASVGLVEHDLINSSGIASIKNTGKSGGITHYYCSDNDNLTHWYIYNKRHLFIACTYIDAKNTYEIIKNNGAYNLNEIKERLLYKYPIVFGMIIA